MSLGDALCKKMYDGKTKISSVPLAGKFSSTRVCGSFLHSHKAQKFSLVGMRGILAFPPLMNFSNKGIREFLTFPSNLEIYYLGHARRSYVPSYKIFSEQGIARFYGSFFLF